jgi:diguanylate cyclase (GGDEF)-like protein/PAS domain S-box-containing protein
MNHLPDKQRRLPFDSSDTRILILAVLITLGALGFFLSTSLVLINRTGQDLEKEILVRNMNRAVAAIDYQARVLDSQLMDWTTWISTNEFVTGNNPQYIEENLTASTFRSSEISFLAIFNQTGELLVARQYDENGFQQLSSSDSLIIWLANQPASLEHKSTNSAWHGIYSEHTDPLLLVSRPILTDEKQGPIRGTMVFGRTLDPANLADISKIAGARISFISPDDYSLPIQSDQNTLSIETNQPAWFATVNNEYVEGFVSLQQFDGNPGLILRTYLPRFIHLSFQQNQRIMVLSILGLGLLFFFIVWFTLRRAMHNRQENQETLSRYQAVVQQAVEAILLVDDEMHILEANPAGYKLLGNPSELSSSVLLNEILMPETECPKDWHEALLIKNIPVECRFRLVNGSSLYAEISASRIIYQSKQAWCIILRDITERNRILQALQESEERYKLAMLGANDGLWDWDLRKGKIYFSVHWKEILGYAEHEFGDSLEDWLQSIHPDDLVNFQNDLNNHLKGETTHFVNEHRLQNKTGNYLWVRARGIAIWDENKAPVRMAGSLTDITTHKLFEEQILYCVLNDSLTGLPNRTLLLDRIKHASERSKRRSLPYFAIILLNIDRFKRINDEFGHAAGDQVLVECARRLRSSIRPSDTVARISGDEFVVLLEEITRQEDVELVFERISQILAAPIPLNDNKTVSITFSCGIVIPDQVSDQPQEILRDVDIAMQYAKKNGRGKHSYFAPEMYRHTIERIALENELHGALERNELFVMYQPIFQMNNNTISGFEALARWNHPQKGIISPTVFIPLAEKTGMIHNLGMWVLKQASMQMQHWQQLFPSIPPLTLNVNLSVTQFDQENLLDNIQQILLDSGLPAGSLCLEITESAMMGNPDKVRRLLNQLKALGVQLFIDDFGAGYSSLSYLQQLPLDGIKIDRSFISNLERSENDRTIVQSIINLAQSLGFKQTAEGVENEAQLKILRHLHSTHIQGFIISKPLNAPDAQALIQHFSSHDEPAD